MKIVLDTNVVISGIFFSGPPYTILSAWHEGRFQILTSMEILEEYLRVGERLNAKYPVIDPNPLIELISVNSTIITPKPLKKPVSQDPDDDKFIACAVSGKADYIVSGDKHLLDIALYQGIKILSPRRFIERSLKD